MTGKPEVGAKTTYRPLYGLKVFWTTTATDINDLPATSPHGSDSCPMQKI